MSPSGHFSPVEEASAFGIIDSDATGKIESFLEKPAEPPSMPGDPTRAYASMGNYIYHVHAGGCPPHRRESTSSKHDMGGNIIPLLTEAGEACVYDFDRNQVPGETEREHGYWRDVGTLDAYFQASMDLVSVEPIFNLYNMTGRSSPGTSPTHRPSSSTRAATGQGGHSTRWSRTGPWFRVGWSGFDPLAGMPGQLLCPGEDSVLFENVSVGRNAVVKRAIIDKNVEIPDGFQVGVDLDHDRSRFTVSDDGIAVIREEREGGVTAAERFPFPEVADLPEDLRGIDAVAAKTGFVPNVFLVMARRPDEFRAFFAYHDALMEKESGLTKAEREMIVVATSAVNDCPYCVVAHGAVLRIRAKDPLIADQWR